MNHKVINYFSFDCFVYVNKVSLDIVYNIKKLKVAFFKENRKNKNTLKATDSWMRHYTTWAENNNVEKDIEKYFAQAKRADGGQYDPTSLSSL